MPFAATPPAQDFDQAMQLLKIGKVGLGQITRNNHPNGDCQWLITFAAGMRMPTAPILTELDRIQRALANGSAVILAVQQNVSIHTNWDLDFDILEFGVTRQQIRNFPSRSGGGGFSLIPAAAPWTIADMPRERLPDGGTVVEPYIGYRDFELLVKDDIYEPSLMSRNGLMWEAYKPMIATCNGNVFAAHDAPDAECQCGIYAFDSPAHRDLKPNANIWGEVYLWGEVIVCETGYRAQYAYPKTLFVRDVGTNLVKLFAQNLEKEYGVPVMLVEHRSGMTAGEIMEHAIRKMLEPPKEGGES